MFINKNKHEHKPVYIYIEKERERDRERQRKFHSNMKLKQYIVTVEENQTTNVTRLPAEPFMFIGYI